MKKDNLNLLNKKIIKFGSIEQILSEINDKKIVFTNGCFDIIHKGHVTYLSQAADLGDVLIVGLNSDFSVKKLKGETRPIQDENSRALVLAAFQFIDFIVIFDEETPFNLISKIKPNILVKGGDYQANIVVGADLVMKNGGEVIIIPFIEGFSSSKIINSL
jgi:D-beta-D-heptose 7-phosphate kinase/D-beta-D-heptose 1-phosphate adenosyltransferase